MKMAHSALVRLGFINHGMDGSLICIIGKNNAGLSFFPCRMILEYSHAPCSFSAKEQMFPAVLQHRIKNKVHKRYHLFLQMCGKRGNQWVDRYTTHHNPGSAQGLKLVDPAGEVVQQQMLGPVQKTLCPVWNR